MKTMTDELKPCPFCGSANVHAYTYKDAVYRQYAVKCKKCGARIMAASTELAIRKWNRRVETDKNVGDKERTAKVEEVEKPNVFKCSECGQYFHSTALGSPVEYCSRCGARLEWE